MCRKTYPEQLIDNEGSRPYSPLPPHPNTTNHRDPGRVNIHGRDALRCPTHSQQEPDAPRQALYLSSPLNDYPNPLLTVCSPAIGG